VSSDVGTKLTAIALCGPSQADDAVRTADPTKFVERELDLVLKALEELRRSRE
jgi:hypothetical protein